MSQAYNNYQDLECRPGTDLNFAMSFTPITLSATGANLTIFGIGPTPTGATGPQVTFPLVATNTFVGVNPYVNFTLTVPGPSGASGATGATACTLTWPVGIYDYIATSGFVDGSTADICIGTVLVTRS